MKQIVFSFIVAVLIAGVSATLAQAGPDMYEKVAEFQFANARAVARDGGSLYLLFGNSLGVVNLYAPGVKVPIASSFTLEGDYTGVTREGDWLYSYSPDGSIAVAHLFGEQIVVLSETLAADSVLSLAATTRYLFCASGYDGILIIDAGDRSHPHLVGRETHGVYYSQVKVDGERLFAVDAFNGVDVFSISGAELTYKVTLPTMRPPSGEIVNGRNIFAWYDGTTLTQFTLSDEDSIEAMIGIRLNRKVVTVSSIGANLLIAFESGLLALYSPDDRIVRDSLQLPFPASALEAQTHEGSGEVAVVDVTGNVRLLTVDGEHFGHQRIVDMPTPPQFLLPLSDRMLAASSSGGIDSYQIVNGGIERRPLYSAAPVYSAITLADSLLFAADNGSGQIAVYDLANSSPLPMAEFDISQPSSKLYSFSHAGGDYDIISIGAGGAELVRYNSTSGFVDRYWEVTSDQPIVTGFWNKWLLGLITDRDTLSLYQAPLGEFGPHPIADFSLPESTQCAAYLQDRYLVLGSKDYVSISELATAYDGITILKELTTINAARDLAFDEKQAVVLAATGDEGIKYFDFSQPSEFNSVFPIISSGSVSRVSVGGEYVYAVTNQGLVAYSARNTEPPIAGLPQTYYVSQNYPNPFNGSTNIEIAARAGEVLSAPLTFEVYNILGQLVFEQQYVPMSDRLRITWNGRDSDKHELSSGLYFLRLRSGNVDVVRKALLLK